MLVVIGLMMTPWSDFLSQRGLQFGVVDALYLDFAGTDINPSVIGSHEVFSLLYCSANQTGQLLPPGTERAPILVDTILGRMRRIG
jgi:hypothetical protein